MIINEGDRSQAQLLIMGQGVNTAYKLLDSKTKICMGLIPDGSIIGLPQVMFDFQPTFSIEASSYCSVAFLHYEKLSEIFELFKQLRF